MTGTATLQFGGNGTQTLTGGGSATIGNLPPVNIAKTVGTLNLASTIRTTNNWSYSAGTISPGASTVVFAGTLTVSGSHALGNVTFNDSAAAAAVYTIASGTTLSVSGVLTLSSGTANGAGDSINTGTLNALGDVTVLDPGGGITGTAILQLGGNGTQTLTGGGSATSGNLLPVSISKTVGTLNLASTIRTTNNWSYSAGTINPGSSTVVFAAALTISGSHTLGNVTFNDGASGINVAYTISAGTTLSVGGTLTLSSGGANAAGDSINTGTLNALVTA